LSGKEAGQPASFFAFRGLGTLAGNGRQAMVDKGKKRE
jgi:hypothetical protein